MLPGRPGSMSVKGGSKPMSKKGFLAPLCAIAAFTLMASGARATGFATCDSGPREGWQSQDKLSAMLKEKGWQVRRIKEDGGCTAGPRSLSLTWVSILL